MFLLLECYYLSEWKVNQVAKEILRITVGAIVESGGRVCPVKDLGEKEKLDDTLKDGHEEPEGQSN